MKYNIYSNTTGTYFIRLTTRKREDSNYKKQEWKKKHHNQSDINKNIYKGYYEQLYTNKLGNLHKMDKVLENDK